MYCIIPIFTNFIYSIFSQFTLSPRSHNFCALEKWATQTTHRRPSDRPPCSPSPSLSLLLLLASGGWYLGPLDTRREQQRQSSVTSSFTRRMVSLEPRMYARANVQPPFRSTRPVQQQILLPAWPIIHHIIFYSAKYILRFPNFCHCFNY